MADQFNILDQASSPNGINVVTSLIPGNSVTLTFPRTVAINYFMFSMLTGGASATPRRPRLVVQDQVSSESVFVQTSSRTFINGLLRRTIFCPGVPRDTGFILQETYLPIPPRLIVSPTDNLIVFDFANVDPVNDQYSYGLSYDVMA
jgi:hypothetical protein